MTVPRWLKWFVRLIVSPLVTAGKHAGWIHPNAEQAPTVVVKPKDESSL